MVNFCDYDSEPSDSIKLDSFLLAEQLSAFQVRPCAMNYDNKMKLCYFKDS
jgi:hypothetical protein